MQAMLIMEDAVEEIIVLPQEKKPARNWEEESAHQERFAAEQR